MGWPWIRQLRSTIEYGIRTRLLQEQLRSWSRDYEYLYGISPCCTSESGPNLENRLMAAPIGEISDIQVVIQATITEV